MTATNRRWLGQVGLPVASRHAIDIAIGQIDQLQTGLAPIETWLRAYARVQPGCRSLIGSHYGVGILTAPTIQWMRSLRPSRSASP